MFLEWSSTKHTIFCCNLLIWLVTMAFKRQKLRKNIQKSTSQKLLGDKAETFQNCLYYILNKAIQEFLVKIKMLFLRSLEIFISSRDINLWRLDTFPTMVANRPVMYNQVPAFGLLLILLGLQLQLYTSLR